MAVRFLRVVLAAGLLGAGLYGLAEVTQNRPDPSYAGQVSELTLRVRTKEGYAHDVAAQGLWAQCRHTVRSRTLASPITQVGAGRFQLVVQPAIGTHGTRRLLGCLEDATTPGVSGQVVDGPRRRPA
ncbi:MAG: hypothetical protein CYG61_07085 [Actinobacteria bacterium]|nr:MAG: hypothetical protein CYG61_07085 [Actinomycetota bacterium]